MNLLEAFDKLNSLTEDTSFIDQFKEYDALADKVRELNTKLQDWDLNKVNGARNAVKQAATKIIEIIPDYNTITNTGRLVNYLQLADRTSQNTLTYNNRKMILNALRSNEGLTFSVTNGRQTLLFKNTQIDTTDQKAIYYSKGHNNDYLDLYYLIDCVDVDSYDEYTEEDPGNLSVSELNSFASSINTIVKGNHWLVPLNSPALKFKNIALASSKGQDEQGLVHILKNVQNKIFDFKANLQDLVDFTWTNLNKLDQLIELANVILTTRIKAFANPVDGFGTDLVYKVVFDQINTTLANTFTSAVKNFISEVTNYKDHYAEYEQVYTDLQATDKKFKNFVFRKPRNQQEKKAKRDYDTKKQISLNSILNLDWYTIGWLAKHIKRLTFTCPEDAIASWKANLGDAHITHKKAADFVDQWGFPELVSGVIVLDVPATSNSAVSADLTKLIDDANKLKAPGETPIADLTDTTKQIHSWKIVNDLVVDHNFQLSPFIQEFDADGNSRSLRYATVRQNITNIKPPETDVDAYKSFMDGYNA